MKTSPFRLSARSTRCLPGAFLVLLLTVEISPLFAQKKIVIEWPKKEASVQDTHPYYVQLEFKHWYTLGEKISLHDYAMAGADDLKTGDYLKKMPDGKKMSAFQRQSIMTDIKNREDLLKKSDEEMLPKAIKRFKAEEPTGGLSCPAEPNKGRMVTLYLYSWKTLVAAYKFSIKEELKVLKIKAGLIKPPRKPVAAKKPTKGPTSKGGAKKGPGGAAPAGPKGKSAPGKTK